MPYLKEKLEPNIKAYDFDDIGVPKNADKIWRQQSTEKWIQKLIKDGKNACLLGQMVIGEILAAPSASQITPIKLCLLEVSDIERIHRLKKSNTHDLDQNILNWASWLRVHHQDPTWTQHVIKENSWEGLDFSQWDKLSSWEKKAQINLIDTTSFSLEEVTKQLVEWIEHDN